MHQSLPAAPVCGVIVGTDGGLYGTTSLAINPEDLEGFGWPGQPRTSVYAVDQSGNLRTLASLNGTNYPYGYGGYGPLLQAEDGSLYGTTYLGGIAGAGGRPAAAGTIFRASTSVFSGVLSFSFNGTNGGWPACGLVRASDGNYYGTTTLGGNAYNATNIINRTDAGTVYRVTPADDFLSLFSFSTTNGAQPFATLVECTNGCLYGTTKYGGAYNKGTIFKITTNGVFASLLSFAGPNGASPIAALVQASDGNLYGTTPSGGARGYGTVFRLSPGGNLTTLLSLTTATGTAPLGGLMQASDGNLYGTTSGNGPGGMGTIFRLLNPPVVTSILQTKGEVKITWSSFTNAIYRVEYATNPAAHTWNTLNPGVVASGISTSVSDNTGDAARFYRVVLLP